MKPWKNPETASRFAGLAEMKLAGKRGFVGFAPIWIRLGFFLIISFLLGFLIRWTPPLLTLALAAVWLASTAWLVWAVAKRRTIALKGGAGSSRVRRGVAVLLIGPIFFGASVSSGNAFALTISPYSATELEQRAARQIEREHQALQRALASDAQKIERAAEATEKRLERDRKAAERAEAREAQKIEREAEATEKRLEREAEAREEAQNKERAARQERVKKLEAAAREADQALFYVIREDFDLRSYPIERWDALLEMNFPAQNRADEIFAEDLAKSLSFTLDNFQCSQRRCKAIYDVDYSGRYSHHKFSDFKKAVSFLKGAGVPNGEGDGLVFLDESGRPLFQEKIERGKTYTLIFNALIQQDSQYVGAQIRVGRTVLLDHNFGCYLAEAGSFAQAPTC